VGVDPFYGSEVTPIYMDENTEVLDRDDRATTWSPSRVHTEMSAYATGYVHADGRYIANRVWFHD
jgi:hypothetical protein